MTEKTTIVCEAIFNEEKTHRFLWKRVWNSKKPMLCVITLNPNSDNVFELDLTSMLVTNNTYRLGNYGGVTVVNLFSCITDRLRKDDFEEEKSIAEENIKYIQKAAKEAEAIVIAWGKSANSNKFIKEKVDMISEYLEPFSAKLCYITDYNGETGLHPLTPSVRKGWELVAIKEE